MPKKGYKYIKEDVIVQRTGKSFNEWRKILNKFDFAKKKRRGAVDLLASRYRINRWWAHVISIRYEYEKKLAKSARKKS